MLSLSQVITLASVWSIFVVSPGPSFAITLHFATARSRRDGMLVAIGVCCAMGVWLLGSLLGVRVLLTRFRVMYELISMLGAFALVVLGIQTIRSATTQASPFPLRARARSAWLSGFLTTMVNPKAVVFFSGLFLLFLPSDLSIWMQATIAILLLLFAGIWYGLVACIFSWGPVGRAYQHVKRWADACLGGIFVVLGLMLLGH